MDVPDKLRAWMNRPPPPPLEQVREFLATTVADSLGFDDLRADLARTAQVNRATVLRDADAIDAMLADPPPPGTLSMMVAHDGNWVLDDPTSDEAAIAWFRELSALIRSVAEPSNGQTH